MVAAVVFPFTLVGVVAWQTREAAVVQIEAEARRAVATTAEHMLKVLETHGLALDLADEATRGLSCNAIRASANLPALLARVSAPSPNITAGREINTVWVIGPNGLVCGTPDGYRDDGKSRLDRDYFAGARDASGNGTFVGRPLTGRVGGRAFFSLARRRSAPEGAFTGVVISSIDTVYLARTWQAMEPLSSGHRIQLYRADGAALAPSAPDQRPDAEADRLVATRWAAAPEGAEVVASPTALEGVVQAWRMLPAWGVVMTDALDRTAALQAWRRTVIVYLLVATLGSGALVGFALAVLRAVRRAQAATRQTEAEVRQRLQAEATLRQAQKIDALGQITGGVAHDFNNLLMAVLGNLEMLRKRLPQTDEKALRLLGNATRGAERGAALTKRMLAFARRQDLQPQATNVVALVVGMEDLLQSALGPHAQIETALHAELAPAWVDPNQLELAIVNLAINARDAMPRGGRVTLAARMRSVGAGEVPGLASGEHLCLAVSDTGEGMDAATLARAVEPFFTTKDRGRGTGLGLSMVNGFARQSGGALVLHSLPGKGTKAELWLPCALGAAPQQSLPPPRLYEGRIAACCVLLVDDDALVRAVTTDLLEDLGHIVVAAGSGPQALELLRLDTRIDVVITDQAMPGMTGTELAAAIATLRPSLPVILATGYADLAATIDPGLRRLSKPFSQDTLANALRAARTPDYLATQRDSAGTTSWRL